jgi:4-amino-4-deoxy-L-arabinose transferase-like glycosyltransferase
MKPGAAKFLRIGSNATRDIRLDWLWLIGFTLLLVGTGVGTRDPWPADEPRFALVVRDMVATGDWLLPRVGGDIYADKPPLFFWIMGAFLWLTHSLRIAFLIPSLLATAGSVLLIYDLVRRMSNRETGLAAGLALLLTLQFVWQGRQAQIDATLGFWCVLSLYGLLRHLLLGPAWGAFALGCAAAGFGVITKGVGFLPLLILIPYALLRGERWKPRLPRTAVAPWLIGVAAFLGAIGLWLVPMLIAANTDPLIGAYRDEILFHQTVGRYTEAWHHRKPFWYFIVSVIPVLWLPFVLLIPWLVPKWRQAWREGDLRVVLPLCWMGIVIVFFSASAGKRGVYILPALPAFVIAAAPYLAEILQRRVVRRLIFGIAVAIAALCVALAAFAAVRPDKRAMLIDQYEIDVAWPLLVIGAAALLVTFVAGPRRPVAAYAGVLAVVLLAVSYWINPVLNDAQSGKAFLARLERLADANAELGFVAFKEQYLLQAHRPLVHFGHARWREGAQEAADAALWLSKDTRRQLVVTGQTRSQCFADAHSTALGQANRMQWFIVRGSANPECVARGKEIVVYRYSSPQ